MKDDELIGMVDSFALRKYQKKHDILLCCSEAEAQYVQYNNIIYRVGWLNPEPPEIKDKYEMIDMILIDQDEYENWIEKNQS
jgi:hypothetical protein